MMIKVVASIEFDFKLDIHSITCLKEVIELAQNEANKKSDTQIFVPDIRLFDLEGNEIHAPP